jgi:alpha-amylase
MKRQCLALSVLAAISCGAWASVPENNTDILLQGFYWTSASTSATWYNQLSANADEIASAGFNMVWLPPPSQAGSLEGYLPEQLNDLNSHYGTETELASLIGTLHSKGVKALADIVINHRNGTGSWCGFANPAWSMQAITSDDEAWGATGSNCSGTRGNPDSGGGYGAARDIDHSQSFVQTSIEDWMNTTLKGVGFDGWRYDYVKGYGGNYVGIYNNATNPYFSVGEYWTTLCYNGEGCGSDGAYPDAHRQQQVNWVTATGGTSAVFDFTTKGLLNKALSTYNYSVLKDSSGKPQGTIGWWPSHSVTFVDNHDTGPSGTCSSGQNLWAVPCDKVMQAYAYIMTHPGVPSVYYPHYFNWGLGSQIKALMQLRKSEGINSNSTVTIDRAEQGLYAAYIDGKVAMKLGSTAWAPSGSGWVLAQSGTDWAVWKKGVTPGLKRTVLLVYGTTASGEDMFVRGGIDHTYAANSLGLACTSSNYLCAIPIVHNNLRNATTAPWKANDQYLDWYGTEASQSTAAVGTAMDWTTDVWPSSWGAQKTVAVDGYGVEPLNTYGQHYWMLDVQMDCSKAVNGLWFEFKTYIKNGAGWEANVSQSGTPYTSGNHFGQCGKVNVFQRGVSAPVSIHDFP